MGFIPSKPTRCPTALLSPMEASGTLAFGYLETTSGHPTDMEFPMEHPMGVQGRSLGSGRPFGTHWIVTVRLERDGSKKTSNQKSTSRSGDFHATTYVYIYIYIYARPPPRYLPFG